MSLLDAFKCVPYTPSVPLVLQRCSLARCSAVCSAISMQQACSPRPCIFSHRGPAAPYAAALPAVQICYATPKQFTPAAVLRCSSPLPLMPTAATPARAGDDVETKAKPDTKQAATAGGNNDNMEEDAGEAPAAKTPAPGISFEPRAPMDATPLPFMGQVCPSADSSARCVLQLTARGSVSDTFKGRNPTCKPSTIWQAHLRVR